MDTHGEYFTQQASHPPQFEQLTAPPHSNVSYHERASASQVGLDNLLSTTNMQSGTSQWDAPSHSAVAATNSLTFRQSGIGGELTDLLTDEQPAYRKLCNSLEASTAMATKLLTENEVLKGEVMALRAELTMLRERGHV